MIQLPDIALSDISLTKLKEYQTEIDNESDFAKKAELAEILFSAKNVIGDVTFDEVKTALDLMCSGARRCVYCEDSLGCEVEHLNPKSLYPEKCFNWENYVYACGLCNKRKSNKFTVFDGATHKLLRITKKTLDNKTKGDDVMINPRKENPMNFCRLDLKNKACRFVITENLEKREKARAEYTFFTMLNLNDVPYEKIRQARENAYSNYFNRLFIYTKHKHEFNEERKEIIIQELKKEQHPTVWKEMQRYYREGWLKTIDSELYELFEESPEALSW
jgi:uncharacterized protein (TIGR02646 family)